MFILASTSPRRIEILKQHNYQFETYEVLIEERLDKNLSPLKNVKNIALNKAEAAIKAYPNQIVVAADTIVVFKNEIIGKPKDLEDAYSMLKRLSGNKHYVITAVAIIKKEQEIVFYSRSSVVFNQNSDEEIRVYLETKESLGKAGSYAIQGEGRKLIKSFKGDYYNIMGLPIKKFKKKFNKFF